MSPKLGGKAAPKKETVKKTPSKTESKSDKTEHKMDKKGAKAQQPSIPEPDSENPAIDLEEIEEQEEASTAAASASSGNAAALAAASGNQEMSASFKNFRHHPDMENFYRFIYDNDLRHEALAIIDEIIIDKNEKKAGKGPKTPAH
jgi:hypothetical protein